MAKKNDICDCNSFEMGFKKDKLYVSEGRQSKY